MYDHMTLQKPVNRLLQNLTLSTADSHQQQMASIFWNEIVVVFAYHKEVTQTFLTTTPL